MIGGRFALEHLHNFPGSSHFGVARIFTFQKFSNFRKRHPGVIHQKNLDHLIRLAHDGAVHIFRGKVQEDAGAAALGHQFAGHWIFHQIHGHHELVFVL